MILGLNAFHGDASAVALSGHSAVALAGLEEERLRRVKHWAGFPSHAIGLLAGQDGAPIETAAIGRKPGAHLFSKALHALKGALQQTPPNLPLRAGVAAGQAPAADAAQPALAGRRRCRAGRCSRRLPDVMPRSASLQGGPRSARRR